MKTPPSPPRHAARGVYFCKERERKTNQNARARARVTSDGRMEDNTAKGVDFDLYVQCVLVLAARTTFFVFCCGTNGKRVELVLTGWMENEWLASQCARRAVVVVSMLTHECVFFVSSKCSAGEKKKMHFHLLFIHTCLKILFARRVARRRARKNYTSIRSGTSILPTSTYSSQSEATPTASLAAQTTNRSNPDSNYKPLRQCRGGVGKQKEQTFDHPTHEPDEKKT